MGIEKPEHEMTCCQDAGPNDGAERARDRKDMAGVAKIISDRLAYRRLLLSVVDRGPDPAVLEALYAKQPHLRGSPMLESKRCSFCGGRTDKLRGAAIEGHNSARICTNCALSIVEELDAELGPWY